MRPILKRPTALPLSPAVQTSSFSSLLSPSSLGLLTAPAPHVRFPSSPTQLVATINTYASDAYDRVPISISPNPVALPGRGERVYSPSIEGFRLSAAPKVFRSLSLAPQVSPSVAEFEDPRSPRLQPAADVTGAKAANAIRFAKMAAADQGPPTRRVKPVENATKTYPRTPYPTAITPENDIEMIMKGKQLPRTANETLETAGARPRRQSREEWSAHGRNKLGLTLNRPIGSPLTRSFAAPLETSSLNRRNKPAPLALESVSTESDKLSNAFWNSVSIESADGLMVTALEYPESAVEYEEKVDIDIRSASQPPLMFAGADGLLFSPGLPRPHARVEKLRESIQSPFVKKASFAPIARKVVTAPSPNDPFAAFPSFGAMLEQVVIENSIQYPAAVVQKD